MLTSKINRPITTLIAGLVVALLSQTATATEELVVDGTAAAEQAQKREAEFQSEIKEYAQSLNEDLKATLDKELRSLPAPKLELAVGEVQTRG
jgi:hypothetical protein